MNDIPENCWSPNRLHFVRMDFVIILDGQNQINPYILVSWPVEIHIEGFI